MEKRSLSYLALGDSYTIGECVEEAESFPYQTVVKLRKNGIKIKAPQIIATTGWTTDELINALTDFHPDHSFDWVTLLIGVNNQYRGRSIDEYTLEFSMLLEKAISYAGNEKSKVIVLSIPDYAVTPFSALLNKDKISAEIDLFNQKNRELSIQAGVHYIDITPISREGEKDAAMQASDGLHPSPKQYTLWADKVALMIAKHTS